MKLITRDVHPRTVWSLEQAGITPLMARLLAARGVQKAEQIDDAVAKLLPPSQLKDCEKAAILLADAILAGQIICIVADYDCDGATACAVGMRGLRMLGASADQVTYVVPDRAIHGYGLTPPLVNKVVAKQAQVLITVDNGMASHEAVVLARSLGMTVIITDHHLPVVNDAGHASLPNAHAIVNPNQPDCPFASKALVGVGVMFYLLLAVRAELRQRGHFTAQSQPRLDTLLDLVALGTVADVGKLDDNNRRLVSLGLKRIRSGRMQPGLMALFHAAGRDTQTASAQDFGFALGPRINAAGRLAEMGVGIECLITDDMPLAQSLAVQLDTINRERRAVESDMRDQAQEALLANMPTGDVPAALCLFEKEFHEGVVGIVASRLKDQLHRPVFVFAQGQDGLLKGSGRSIAGFHLRDALDLLNKRHPELLKRFGGHAMAAGCTIELKHFSDFQRAFTLIAEQQIDADVLLKRLFTDGKLAETDFSIDTAYLLDQAIWGPGFDSPIFQDEVTVLEQKLVGERHLKLSMKLHGKAYDGIWFGRSEPLPQQVTLAYRLAVNEFRGRKKLQMVIEAMDENSP